MPKLSPDLVKRETETTKEWGTGFEPVPPGRYLARLTEVDGTGNGPKGPYWAWTFEGISTPTQPVRSKFWLNTSLSKEAEGSFKQVFNAFGYSLDSDTDEMLGEVVCLVISVRTIKKGPKMGQPTNSVDAVLPATEHPEYGTFEIEAGPFDGAGSKGGASASRPDDWE